MTLTPLKIEKEAGIVEPGSNTFGVSKEMWPRLEQLILESESIGVRANRMISSLESSIEKDGRLALACNGGLKDFYALACGEWRPQGFGTEEEKAKERCTLFWSSIRAALHDQFRGFAVPDDKFVTAIHNAAVVSTATGEAREIFWQGSAQIQNKIGRIWFLVAYKNLLQPDTNQRNERIRIKDLDTVFGEVSNTLRAVCSSGKRFSGFDMARRFAVWRLLNKYMKEIFPSENREQFGVPSDEKLVERFLKLLSRDLDSGNKAFAPRFRTLIGRGAAPAVEISLLMRVLAGRYLNRHPAQMEWEKDHLRKGVQYVLSRGGRILGTAKDCAISEPVPTSILTASPCP